VDDGADDRLTRAVVKIVDVKVPFEALLHADPKMLGSPPVFLGSIGAVPRLGTMICGGVGLGGSSRPPRARGARGVCKQLEWSPRELVEWEMHDGPS
jgi:hypothetical protein